MCTYSSMRLDYRCELSRVFFNNFSLFFIGKSEETRRRDPERPGCAADRRRDPRGGRLQVPRRTAAQRQGGAPLHTLARGAEMRHLSLQGELAYKNHFMIFISLRMYDPS